jgi:ammonium transporter Rh
MVSGPSSVYGCVGYFLQDFGGSIAIHAFGAYYGLAATLVLYKSSSGVGGSHAKNGAAYINDLTAMVGTIFLWVFWPSFNAAIATVSADSGVGGDGGVSSAVTTSALRMYAVVNTVLSLCGATLSTFAACSAFKGKLDMVLVQNATLAGGVAVGSATTMLVGGSVINVSTGGAVAVGALAGALHRPRGWEGIAFQGRAAICILLDGHDWQAHSCIDMWSAR